MIMFLTDQVLTVCILITKKTKPESNTSDISPLDEVLFPIDGKPLLVHILEKLPKTAEIYIAAPYPLNQLKDFLLVHSASQKIKFIDTTKVDSDCTSSNQTRSAKALLHCKEHLRSPFLIVDSNSFWTELLDTDLTTNTIYTIQRAESDPVDDGESCKVHLVENQRPSAVSTERLVTGFTTASSKTLQSDSSPEISIFESFNPAHSNGSALLTSTELFSGVAFVQDYRDFFLNLELALSESQDVNICSGFSSLVAKKKCVARELPSWKSAKSLINTSSLLTKTSYFLSKKEETSFLIKNHTIKFINSSELCKKRVERFYKDSDIHPQVLSHGENFYSYKHTPGPSLKKQISRQIFESFLNFCTQKLWIQKEELHDFREDVLKFYKENTLAHLDQFRIHNPDHPHLDTFYHFLNTFDWSSVVDNAVCFRYHGDLQLENVILHQGSFQLIEFGQNLSSTTDCGDLQYDFASLLTSLIIDSDSLMGDSFLEVNSADCADLYSACLRSRVASYDVSFSVVESLVPIVLINRLSVYNKKISLNTAQAVYNRISHQQKNTRPIYTSLKAQFEL